MTNFGDMKIMEFHEKEMATKKDEERDRVSLVPLQVGIRAAFGEKFGMSVHSSRRSRCYNTRKLTRSRLLSQVTLTL